MIFGSYKQGRDSAEIPFNPQRSPAPLLVSAVQNNGYVNFPSKITSC